jgi:formamidopyrimidine-DNA glycosylase
VPELPEVEVIHRQLEPLLTGKRITQLEIFCPEYVKGNQADLLAQHLPGKEILAVRRHGKMLLLDIERGGSFTIRLGMTGRILYKPSAEALAKHTHWLLRWDDANGKELRGVDPRRFGELGWLEAGEAVEMGTDALVITAAEFAAKVKRRASPIYNSIMDQKVLAGVGNIYACESLFGADIHPLRPSNSLTSAEIEHLITSIQSTLINAIEHGGSTIADYVGIDGKPGAFVEQHRVYDRAAKPCPVCGTPIAKVTIAARSVYFCPHCQPEGGPAC